jgi:chromosome segregation ATPase
MRRFSFHIQFALILLMTFATARATTDSPQVSQAKKRLADAQTEVSRAKGALSQIVNKAIKELEATPEWKEAAARLKSAQAKQAVATRTAQQKLRSNTNYQAALAERSKIQGQRDTLRNTPNASSDTLAETAVALLKATTVLSRMESDALAADPDVSQAKAEVDAANQNLDLLRKRLPDLTKKEPGFDAARQRLEQAASQMREAAKQVDDAKKQQEKDDERKLNDEINNKRDQLPGLFRR